MYLKCIFINLNHILSGTVELDEKYFGGKPRPKVGVRYKSGKGTKKQAVLVAVERQSPVRSALINSDMTAELQPWVEDFVQKDAHLMTDENHSYGKIGRQYASHQWVKHAVHEFSRGEVHNNTAESFSALLERAMLGVFHYMSAKHLKRYLNEIGFRWDHRLPKEKKKKDGTKKVVMIAMPAMTKSRSLLTHPFGRQIRQSKEGGIQRLSFAWSVSN